MARKMGFSRRKARKFAQAYMENWNLGIGERHPSMTANFAMRDMGMNFFERFVKHNYSLWNSAEFATITSVGFLFGGPEGAAITGGTYIISNWVNAIGRAGGWYSW